MLGNRKRPFVLIQRMYLWLLLLLFFVTTWRKASASFFLPVKWNNSEVGSTELKRSYQPRAMQVYLSHQLGRENKLFLWRTWVSYFKSPWISITEARFPRWLPQAPANMVVVCKKANFFSY